MAQHQVDQLKTGIWSVKELLLILDQLRIPDYQRPYKWTEKNLNALVNDKLTKITNHAKKFF